MRFAYGVEENAQLTCALERMQQTFAQSGGQIRELLLATTRTAHFRVRQPGAPVMMPPGEPQPDGGTAEPEPEPDPTGEPANEDVSVTTRRDSSWAAGHCETVMVKNETGMPLDWSVELMIEGTLTDHWNSSASANTGTVTFTGADWNRTVAPGATAEFGYCVSTTG
jgi:cellulase/cellobiase CelA1